MASQIYSVDDVPPAITNLIVTHIRVVAHSMGPVALGAQLSQNHWSLYLVHSRGSVRLNMQLQDASSNSTRGLLTVTNHPYTTVPNSAVRSWEFQGTTRLTVYHLLQAIIDKGRSNYNMTEGGVGCRYWIRVVMSDWKALEYILASSTDGVTLDDVINYNYSISIEPIYLEVIQGTFVQGTGNYPMPITSSSSIYSTSTSTYPAPIASSSSYPATTYSVSGASYPTAAAAKTLDITGWSEWAWHEDRGQWWRYRMSGGKYEYQYCDPATI